MGRKRYGNILLLSDSPVLCGTFRNEDYCKGDLLYIYEEDTEGERTGRRMAAQVLDISATEDPELVCLKYRVIF